MQVGSSARASVFQLITQIAQREASDHAKYILILAYTAQGPHPGGTRYSTV
jgi:hypothetical protein